MKEMRCHTPCEEGTQLASWTGQGDVLGLALSCLNTLRHSRLYMTGQSSEFTSKSVSLLLSDRKKGLNIASQLGGRWLCSNVG